MRRVGGQAAITLLAVLGTAGWAAPDQGANVAPTPTPAPPQIAFPGQYAAAPAAWLFPVWSSGCRRFTGEERVVCLEFVASDYGRLSRFAEANSALAPKKAGSAGSSSSAIRSRTIGRRRATVASFRAGRT